MLKKQQKRYRKHRRMRSKLKGTTEIPRLCVFRSKNHIYAQLIDDEKGKTLISASDRELKSKTKNQKPKTKIKQEKIKEGQKTVLTEKVAIAFQVGKLIAERASEKKIKKVVFDRAGYAFHGRVKALAGGAREGGLRF